MIISEMLIIKITIFTEKASKPHLDSFLSKNTSEDNESFAQILEEADKKHREKHAWLFENEDNRTQVRLLPKIFDLSEILIYIPAVFAVNFKKSSNRWLHTILVTMTIFIIFIVSYKLMCTNSKTYLQMKLWTHSCWSLVTGGDRSSCVTRHRETGGHY